MQWGWCWWLLDIIFPFHGFCGCPWILTHLVFMVCSNGFTERLLHYALRLPLLRLNADVLSKTLFDNACKVCLWLSLMSTIVKRNHEIDKGSLKCLAKRVSTRLSSVIYLSILFIQSISLTSLDSSLNSPDVTTDVILPDLESVSRASQEEAETLIIATFVRLIC